jgi:hypothetical protein
MVVARAGRLTTIAALLAAIAGCGDASTEAKGEVPPADEVALEVVLLPADEPGQAPFGPSFGESLAASVDRGTPGDAIGRSLSVEPVDGDEPGLYGRVDRQAPCDLQGLIDLYAASPTLTEVVAAVLDVSAIQLSSFLRSYVAVATTRDTFVIDHHLVDGAAVRSPAVLEAGTTVLIDDRGLPRLRCASASPLTQPRADEVAGIGDADRVGEPWTGFDPGRIVVVARAPEQISALDLAALVR